VNCIDVCSPDKADLGRVCGNGRFIQLRTVRLTGLRVMMIPKLKRIKVSSEQEVMIVTCNKKYRDKHVSSDQVRDALSENGWAAGQRYTLDGNLVGHVVSHI
jgi:hypothetical protein